MLSTLLTTRVNKYHLQCKLHSCLDLLVQHIHLIMSKDQKKIPKFLLLLYNYIWQPNWANVQLPKKTNHETEMSNQHYSSIAPHQYLSLIDLHDM